MTTRLRNGKSVLTESRRFYAPFSTKAKHGDLRPLPSRCVVLYWFKRASVQRSFSGHQGYLQAGIAAAARRHDSQASADHGALKLYGDESKFQYCRPRRYW